MQIYLNHLFFNMDGSENTSYPIFENAIKCEYEVMTDLQEINSSDITVSTHKGKFYNLKLEYIMLFNIEQQIIECNYGVDHGIP